MTASVVDRRGQTLALAALLAGGLLLFPVALVLSLVARARIPAGGSFRRVAAAALALGLVEAALFAAGALVLLLHDPFPSRRRAAADQMRKIRAAQERYREERRCDRDGDGVGEYGALPELAADPPLISTVFRAVTSKGYAEKYGYYFAVFLPGRSWEASAPPQDPDVADARESAWIAYAWPAVDGGTATGVFVADAHGVYRSENRRARFDGESRMPTALSALAGRGLDARVPVDGTASNDGETWARVD